MPRHRRVFVAWCCFLVALTATGASPADDQRRVSFSGPEPQALIERDMLAAHNQIRKHAELRPLTWSESLAAVAQDWANHLLSEGQFYHRPRPKYGENLLEISGARALGSEVVAIWAGEASNYSYSSNTCHGVCGHYTQLIWSSTREVGCAVAHDGRREVWVCNYNPPGNWVGERPY